MEGRAHLGKLLDAISLEEHQRIEPYLHTVELRQGQLLVEANETIENVWFPAGCVTSTIVNTPDGSTIEVGLMGVEGLIGISLVMGSTKSNTTVVVQIPGAATRMSAGDFLEHVVKPRSELFRLLLVYIDAFLAMVAQTAACNSLHEIEQRLARWILMTHDRVARDDLPLTQEFIAYMLGVRRASVSIAAAALQQRQLIRYSRGRLLVVDRRGLELHSCPCYAIVRNISENLYRNVSYAF
jgi:CRP-like cAMP-binding protein